MPLEQVNLPLNYQNCGQLNCGHAAIRILDMYIYVASKNTLEIEVKSLNTHKILIQLLKYYKPKDKNIALLGLDPKGFASEST